MIDLEKQKHHFRNHVASFLDLGNIKILDFKNPNSSDYRIRFLFEEDYYRLHISGDIGELIACNYQNMTFDGFKDFLNDTGYFKEKVCCHNRPFYRFSEEKARKELSELVTADDLQGTNYHFSWDADEERVSDFLDDVMWDFSNTNGLGPRGYELLDERIGDVWEWGQDLGKESTGILDLYMLAFKLATEQLENRMEI